MEATDLHLSFDLDGTLIDSIPLMKESWNNVNSSLDINVPWSLYRENLGLPFDQIMKNLNICSLSDEIYKMYFEFNKKNINLIKPMPGLDDLLRWLKFSKISWSIITSKPTWTACDIIKKFNIEPQLLICADSVSPGKPSEAPANLLRSKIRSVKYYYIGDTLVDQIFSMNAGFEFIRYYNRNSEIPSVGDWVFYIKNKTRTISHLSKLKDLLELL